jgi:hypothetical protein
VLFTKRSKQRVGNDPPQIREVKHVLSRSFPPILWISRTHYFERVTETMSTGSRIAAKKFLSREHSSGRYVLRLDTHPLLFIAIVAQKSCGNSRRADASVGRRITSGCLLHSAPEPASRMQAHLGL